MAARAHTTLRLTLALVGVIAAVLVVAARQRGVHEAAVDEEDRRRDQRVLGRALEESAERSWRERGLRSARERVAAADAHVPEIEVELLEESAALDDADASPSAAWERDEVLQRREPQVLRSFLRIDGPGGQRRALALTTPLRDEVSYVREALIESAGVTLVLLFAATIAALWLERALVGRRVDRLVARARSIGAGDLAEQPADPRMDELGQLSSAIEHMARALASARQTLDDEAYSRVAATAHLRRSDRLATVGTLAAGLAHELAPPLHAIDGRARRMVEAASACPDLRDAAAAIVDQSARVQRIVEELRDFAHPQPTARRPVDVVALLRADLELLDPLLRQRGATWTLSPPPSASTRPLRGDADQLRQVFTNLILNAAQAMPGGGAIEVVVASDRQAPRELVAADREAARRRFTRITVRDHGGGIRPEALTRLFDPFFTTKEVGEGSGLGLAVAHGIVSDHGGWIAAESVLGAGSVFCVWLPELSAPRDAAASPRA
ncbi:MAG: HAMP domain-containing protein [Myxococcales bacterium]|nr:HAMP domain-containing protein [Myxococcales bacterium]